MKKFIYTISIIIGLFFSGTAYGASFYVDFGAVAGGVGTASTTSYNSLDAFMEVARTAGDICFVRRGTSTTTSITDLDPLSDGQRNNPLICQADLDNIWSDFATSTQTYTVTQGSLTMTASANITGIAAGDWIYVEGDCYERYNPSTENTCEYAYEVLSVSGTTLTLYMPYIGGQSGAGFDLRVMPDNPIRGSVTDDFQLLTNGDQFWRISGLDIRGTDANCTIQASSGSYANNHFRYMISRQDGVTSCGFNAASRHEVFVNGRLFGGTGFQSGGAYNSKNFYIDCNNAASSFGVVVGNTGRNSNLENGNIVNCTNGIIVAASGGGVGGGDVYIRNVKHNGSFGNISGGAYKSLNFKDEFGLVSSNRLIISNVSSVALSTTTMSTTTNLRSGGGAQNTLVMPPSGNTTTGLSTNNFPESFIPLFSYSIYSDGTSKTYEMYFMSTTTSNFTTDPLATEFWIECEYYVDSVDADTAVKKSTGVIDFNGSTAWQSLSVTCDPSQAGILYLRGWYGKTKETPTNWFYIDNKPVIN